MTPNSHLPAFILCPDDAGQWHLRDSHGRLLFEGLGLCLDTLLSVAEGTGAKYQITIPLPTKAEETKQKKGNPNVSSPN